MNYFVPAVGHCKKIINVSVQVKLINKWNLFRTRALHRTSLGFYFEVSVKQVQKYRIDAYS